MATAALLVTAGGRTDRVAAQQAAGQQRVDVIIGFDRTPGPPERALIESVGGQVRFSYHLIPAIAASLPQPALAGLANNPRISVIEPDLTVQAVDAELDNSWGVKKIGGGGTTVGGTTYTGSGQTVFILDSGIDYTHPDLAANYSGAGSGLNYDFVNNDPDPYDDNDHGTHVAGTIAAVDNNSGVIGVAPGAKLASVKVLDANGSGAWSGIIAALEWAVDHGAKVTNNSYGSSSYPGTLVEQAYAAAEAAGVVTIASAGNSGNCSGKGDSVGYPGKFSSVIAIAATDVNNARPCFSSSGPAVAFAAPGVAVVSTIPGNQYASYSGTSMSSPHVAGLIALLLEAGLNDANDNGKVTDEARAALKAGALDLGATGRDNLYGDGLVNAPASLSALLNTAPPPAGRTAVVQSITYNRTGPAKKDLGITVTIVDSTQAAISGASVAVGVTKDGSNYASGSGTTNSAGVVTFQIKNAPNGCYHTDVTTISAPNVTFGGSEPSNNFCG
jgi:subtilisin family serine protease